MNKLTQKKVLIVGNDPGDILWLKKILKPDYLVIEAHDVLHAIEMADREHPDLVLMDVMVPQKSGYTLCAHLKSNPNTKDISVVMVTGLGTEINKEIGEEMGADGYLVKPVWPNQLHNIISRLLKSGQ